jgi:predicted TIM-barrel fold metal-dependent hydrolase
VTRPRQDSLRLILASAAILLAAASQAAAQDRVFDGHVHLWAGEESLLAYEADAATVKAEVVGFAAMWFGGPNQAPQGRPEDIREGNDRILALRAGHPKALPVITVHPYDGEAALAELERTAALGARVLKIHPHTQGFDAADPRVLATVKRAGELGLVVLMDNAGILPGDSEKLFNLALQAPGTRFIFAHIGGLKFRFWNVLSLVRTAEALFANNVYFDISATALIAADSPLEAEFIWTLRNVGIDRVILGSDYPQFGLRDALLALERLDLTDAERSRIASGNATDLFGLQ